MILIGEISEMNDTLKKLPEIDEQILALGEKRNEILWDLQKKEEEHNGFIISKRMELAEIEELADKAKHECTESENRKKAFDTEYDIKKNDLDIYYTRIKTKFEHTFPGREMPMIP